MTRLLRHALRLHGKTQAGDARSASNTARAGGPRNRRWSDVLEQALVMFFIVWAWMFYVGVAVGAVILLGQWLGLLGPVAPWHA